MSYKYEYLTLTQIGDLFGESNQEVGKWLATVGLRHRSNGVLKPTPAAFDGGFVTDVAGRNQGYSWAWHTRKTVEALVAAGHRLVSPLPTALVHEDKLNAPFAHRPNDQFGYQVVSGDGTVAVWVRGETNARLIARLLNLADKHGLIAKAMGSEAVARSTAV